MDLILEPNIEDPDGFYDELLRAHADLSEDESDALNARLILVLCNHVGDRGVLRRALAAAAAGEDRPAFAAGRPGAILRP